MDNEEYQRIINEINQDENNKLSSEKDNIENQMTNLELSSENQNIKNQDENIILSTEKDNIDNQGDNLLLSTEKENIENKGENTILISEKENIDNQGDNIILSPEKENRNNQGDNIILSPEKENRDNQGDNIILSPEKDNIDNQGENILLKSEKDNIDNQGDNILLNSEKDNVINQGDNTPLNSENVNEVKQGDNTVLISEKEDKDIVFNRLKNLQTLLKKESALKELFIKTSNETKKNIEEQCREIYKKKLDVFLTQRRLNKKENNEQNIKKFELIDQYTEHLKDLSNYIPKLLKYLWEDPKMMTKLLLNSENNDIKKSLAPFLANNFYENILSFNYMQENFMFVLSLLCKEEISQLKLEKDLVSFLQETPCGYLLEQLINKIDIKSYFNKILKDIIENIEIKCSDRDMIFLIKNIDIQIKNRILEKAKNSNIKGKTKNIKEEENDVYRKNPTEKINFNICEILSFTNTNLDDCDNDESLTREKLDKESSKLFSEKYTPDLTSKDFIENINKFEDDRMKKYLSYHLKFCETQDDYFSNKTFFANIFKSQYSTIILNEYQLNFMKVILIIKEIFNKLLSELHLLPYSVKCLCKIILLLIRKRFPDITTVEENAFIAKFFFCKLFNPIFKNPSTGALINNFIISENTLSNLNVISSIILQLVSGRLYRAGGLHGDFTPFNWFFIEEMPFVLKFFENLTKVELPKFIDDFINDKLNDDYVYDYFKENPEKIIFHRSICFNIYDIKSILENMKKKEDIIFENKKNSGLYKTFDKLYNKKNKALLNELVSNQDNLLKNTGSNNSSLNYNANANNSNEKEINLNNEPLTKTSSFFSFGKKKKEITVVEPPKKDSIIHYYLITDLLINSKYKHIFDLNQKTYNYNIKELKECKSEEDKTKNIVIKVKNFFSSLLCNYRSLVKTDFDKGTTYKTLDILKELKSFMKSSNFVIDGSIPSEWYVNSLIRYLKQLPQELVDNEYELLFKDLENDLNKSIKELDFETLSICLNKIKFIHKGIVFYENTKQILIDILLNNKVAKIVEKEEIKVEIKFKYDKKKKFKVKKLELKQKQLYLLDSMVYEHKKKHKKECYTVKEFCKNFPNLIEYQEKQGYDVLLIQSELEMPKRLQVYFDIIREHLSKTKKITDNNSFEIINEKIYDYVMSKIYSKIFPTESDNKDNKIFENTVKLSWVEPKHFIPGKKNYVYDSFLPDVIKDFELLYKEKSPRKKIISMSNIFASISNLVKFNNEGTDNIGVDDQMPILNYSLIKAQPQRFYSICRFLDLYIGDLKSKSEGNQLTQLSGICDRVINISYNSLINVTAEEFKIKCAESAYGIGIKKQENYFV